MGADGGGAIGATGGVLVEGAGPPDVRAAAMDLGVVDGRDVIAVPDPTGGGLDQAGQVVGDAALVPAAVLGEGLQGLPGGGLLQGQDRLGDGVLLDVERHGGDPLGEAAEAAAGERAGEGLEQGLPDGPRERSFGHGASPVPEPMGMSAPGRFRPGDAAFNTVLLISNRCTLVGKLLNGKCTGSEVTMSEDTSRIAMPIANKSVRRRVR